MTFERYFILKRLQAIMFPFIIIHKITHFQTEKKNIRNGGNCVCVGSYFHVRNKQSRKYLIRRLVV